MIARHRMLANGTLRIKVFPRRAAQAAATY
jgi:hypothetical protein